MINENKQMLLALRTQLINLVNQYNRLENTPYQTGEGEMLFPSEMHAIEAIGKKTGNTVTELSIVFGITKGAVSQTISKLIHRGLVYKSRSSENRKEVIIDLTQKGQEVFNKHAAFHEAMDRELLAYADMIPAEKIMEFQKILDLVNVHLKKYIQLQKKDIRESLYEGNE